MPREREGYIEKRVVKVGEREEVRLYVRMQYRDPYWQSLYGTPSRERRSDGAQADKETKEAIRTKWRARTHC